MNNMSTDQVRQVIRNILGCDSISSTISIIYSCIYEFLVVNVELNKPKFLSDAVKSLNNSNNFKQVSFNVFN